jgi:hypothetical protein
MGWQYGKGKGAMDQRSTRKNNGNGGGGRKRQRIGEGYGYLQLKLLKTLDEHPAFFLVDLLGGRYERAQYVALHRAAQNLWQQRKLDIWKLGGGGTNTMWIARLGYRCAHHEVPRINGAAEQAPAIGYFRREVGRRFPRSRAHPPTQRELQSAQRKWEVERARARMSPEMLEKIRKFAETGTIPKEESKVYRRF